MHRLGVFDSDDHRPGRVDIEFRRGAIEIFLEAGLEIIVEPGPGDQAGAVLRRFGVPLGDLGAQLVRRDHAFVEQQFAQGDLEDFKVVGRAAFEDLGQQVVVAVGVAVSVLVVMIMCAHHKFPASNSSGVAASSQCS